MPQRELFSLVQASLTLNVCPDVILLGAGGLDAIVLESNGLG